MCDSIADGGKRCAAHTRPPFKAIIAELDAIPYRGHQKERTAIRMFRDENNVMARQKAVDYASTPSGQKDVLKTAQRFRDQGDLDTYRWLVSVAASGREKAQIDKETRAKIRKTRVKKNRAARKSRTPLTKSTRMGDGVLAIAYPEAAAMWHPTKNVDENTGEILTAAEVDGGSNATVWWRCPDEGHEWFSARCNNATQDIRRGNPFRCPICTGRRSKSLESMQDDFTAFVDAFGGDPKVWESLSPATQYLILKQQGMLTGSGDTFRSATALSMLHGDCTLEDVLEAKNAFALDRVVAMEGVSDEDENSAVIEFNEDTPVFDQGRFPDGDRDTRIDRVMASAGAAGLPNSTELIVEQVLREGTENLWNEVHADETKLDEVLQRVRTAATKNEHSARLAARFEADVQKVRSTPLPDGYSSDLTLPDGTTVAITPTLAQRRYALKVADKRVYANWSGTGAGKTLSGILATGQIGARETLVVCPAGTVVTQWGAEFERAFPGTKVREGMPEAGEHLDRDPSDTSKRVWILNYDKLSGDRQDVEDRMGPLMDRLDATILDEVHMAKATGDKTASRRHRALQGLLDRAREANSTFALMPTTATPVITGLEEVKSIATLMYGEAPAGMRTTPTLKNAAAAYHLLSSSGTRVKPAYTPTLTRTDATIDVTDHLPEVLARMERIADGRVRRKKADYDELTPAEKTQHGPFNPEKVRDATLSHPATMERALLPERLPALVEKVRASDSPVVVYSEYTTGMIPTIVKRLQDSGIPAAKYTGSESQTERDDLIRRFQQGEIRALVGSRAIATGVDGLQRVSNHMIVASMPWTAAGDDQLVGRVHRTGQTENVIVEYLMAEAKTGDGRVWSYDRGRKNRIEYRRSLGDAAVDGKMPDGELGSSQAQASQALSRLRGIVADAAGTGTAGSGSGTAA